jgi:predicted ribonuclease YlaK
VLDTNVLLECRPLAEIPWADVLAGTTVGFVIPLRVIEELDEKKRAPRRDLARRARNVLPALERVLAAGGELSPGVSVEVPIEPGARRRPNDADQEIIETCVELAQLSARQVRIVTARPRCCCALALSASRASGWRRSTGG